MTEHIKEQGSQKQKSLTEQAKDAVQNIQKLAGNIDFKKVFPGMEKLMNTPDGEKTFSKISDLSQVCAGQNNAIDRKKMGKMCGVIDPEARS